MKEADSHLALKSRGVQAAKFYKKYNQNEEFTVKVIDTTKGGLQGGKINLTFAWNDIINNMTDIMFFGLPFNNMHLFNQPFWMKSYLQYLLCIFKYWVNWGDAYALA